VGEQTGCEVTPLFADKQIRAAVFALGRERQVIEMESVFLEMPTRVTPPFEMGTLGALDATTSGETSVIARSDESLIRQLIQALDRQLLVILNCRSASECEKARREIWQNYARSRRALSDMINVVVPIGIIDLFRASTSERIASDLERARNVLFSEEIADQMEFTMWISDRMQFIGHQISIAGDPKDRDADIKLNADFHLYTMWGQFHYDCVLASMKFQLPIPSAIQDPIRDGLRAWVNASAIMEEALALRMPDQEQSSEVQLPWDEEDQELLDSSMKDLDAESASDL
jgi:hypothetical protein